MLGFCFFVIPAWGGLQGRSRRATIVYWLTWDAGGCPAATFFLCFAKERRQRKATRGSSPHKSAGFPSETVALVSGSASAKRCFAKPLPHLETTGRCGTRARMGKSRKVAICARPQTVLAECPCRSCVTRRLSSGPTRSPTNFPMNNIGASPCR